MDIKEIRNLIDLMKKNGIAVFKLEREGFSITLKTDAATQQVFAAPAPLPAYPPPHSQPLPTAATSTSIDQEAPKTTDYSHEIKSPMVGTFYSAPAPDAAPFVTVGQTISADTTVCILEAMKVMNEIKAEVSGTVVEVCAENGKPVQFGQTLFRVR